MVVVLSAKIYLKKASTVPCHKGSVGGALDPSASVIKGDLQLLVIRGVPMGSWSSKGREGRKSITRPA